MTEQKKDFDVDKQLIKIQQAKRIALTGYWGLFILVPMWHLVLAPHEAISSAFLLTLWWLPLFFPMKGLIQGKPYTYAWVNFLTMFYFLHSLTMIYAEPDERYLAIIELVLASLFFYGACYYARWQGQYMGLGLKKLNKK
ncbi:DUF2069 domain-containing protein [Catenovulum sp. SM1970]|uniref:DUF2069 domain-containing protein n=1 Tax=Marinifaba aquimaris TaxID=2741323 RepID=UPI0015725249|nr:DUF2069 domain-containing protein [Marinifaba aquimaris]NTS75968.1 DUF2069 domain-containing protein [Marinifaba aquimaris]